MNRVFFLLVVVLILFTACERTQNFGIDLLPQEDLIKAQYVDTFTVTLKTEPYTHIKTNNTQSVLFGSYYDPVFGYTKASFVTQVQQFAYPPFNDSTNYTVDSVILIFALDQGYSPYGKPYNPVPIKVYEVSDTLHFYSDYYADDDPSKFTDYHLLGETEFSYTQNDTALKIYLNNELGQRFLDSVDYYFYTENDPFSNRFKGLYITPGDGFYDAAIYKITFTGDLKELDKTTSFLYIYYHPDTLPDTTFLYKLYITSILNTHFTLIQHNYDGTNVFNPNIDSVVYLQTAGTRVKIDIPYLYRLSNKVVHKAELVLNLENPVYTQETSYPPPDELYLVGFDPNDSTQTPIMLEEYYSRDVGKYHGFTKVADQYSLNITRLAQKLIQSDSYTSDSTNYYLLDIFSNQQLTRAVLTTQKNSKPAKLIIFYSDY